MSNLAALIIEKLGLPAETPNEQVMEVIGKIISDAKKAEDDALEAKNQLDSFKTDTNAKIEALSLEIETKDQAIADLTAQLANFNTNAAEEAARKDGAVENVSKEVEINVRGNKENKTVTFLVPKFKFDGVEYTAEEAANDPELIARLVSIKSGIISVS